jgi:hypothetical protein
MVGQEAHGWWGYAENTTATWEMTVKVDKRDTFAEVALTGWSDMGESPAGYIGIIKMVSDSGTETFLQDGWWGSHSYRQGVLSHGRDQRSRPARGVGRVRAGTVVTELLVMRR